MGPRLAILVGFAALAAGAGWPGVVHAQAVQASAPDFVVAYRYEKKDPSGTFKSMAYDRRKGQYDAKRMAAWVEQVKAESPGTTAYLGSVYLDKETGLTEGEKLASAIDRERKRIAGPPPAPSRAPRRGVGTAPRGEDKPVGRVAEARAGRTGSPGPARGLAGSSWSFRPNGPLTHEFLPDGKMKHHTTSRVALGEWEQTADSFSLWVGPSREEPDFVYKGKVRGDQLEGLVKSRMFPGESKKSVRDLWTDESAVTLHRLGAHRGEGRPSAEERSR